MSEKCSVKNTYYTDSSLETVSYYKNGILHRLDGPAYLWYRKDGSLFTVSYIREGKFYREDGPAFIQYSREGRMNYVEFWMDDKQLDFWDFFERSSSENQKILLENWLQYHVGYI
jgi:antitoxin component YwqK of YwqJK toxin-antitoxin module